MREEEEKCFQAFLAEHDPTSQVLEESTQRDLVRVDHPVFALDPGGHVTEVSPSLGWGYPQSFLSLLSAPRSISEENYTVCSHWLHLCTPIPQVLI